MQMEMGKLGTCILIWACDSTVLCKSEPLNE